MKKYLLGLCLIILVGCNQKGIYFQYQFTNKPLEGIVFDSIKESDALYEMNRGMVYFEWMVNLTLSEEGGLTSLYQNDCITISNYIEEDLIKMIELAGYSSHIDYIDKCVIITEKVDLNLFAQYYGFKRMVSVLDENLHDYVVTYPGIMYSSTRDYKTSFSNGTHKKEFTLTAGYYAIKYEALNYVVLFEVDDVLEGYSIIQALDQQMSQEKVIEMIKQSSSKIYVIDNDGKTSVFK